MASKLPRLVCTATAKLIAALDRYCRDNEKNQSHVIRRAVADAIGQPKLADVPSRGPKRAKAI